MALPASVMGSGGQASPGEEDNLWAGLLKEVAANKGNSLPRKSLLVLGDRDSGKTTLLAKLQGNEDPKKGSGLEFGYIEARSEDDDDESEDLTLLNHWVLDGDVRHSNLLKFALTENLVADTTAMICVSLSTPWDVMDQLNKWVTVLHDHLDTLQLSGQIVSKLKEKKQASWESYVEPGLDFVPGKYGGLSGPNSLGSPTSTPHISSTFQMTDLSPHTDEQPDDMEGVLTRNLGLDLVIVLTKTDAMTSLESEHGMTDQHFDFIQQAVRRFSLQYGASLFYTSVKEDKNCDLLYKYLVHQNYGLVPFSTPALVVERDALFIPAGWDTLNKISILYENLFNFSPEQPFSQVIKSPFLKHHPTKQHINKTIEVVAEKEQDFLSRIAPFLMSDTIQSTTDMNRALAAASRLGPAESVLKTPERRVMGSPGVHSALKRSEFSGMAAGMTKGSVPPTDGAISNFFHALLNKKSAVSPNIHARDPSTTDLKSTTANEVTQLDKPVEGQTVLENQIQPIPDTGEAQIRS